MEHADGEIKFTVVDFNFIMGASVDRAVNVACQVKTFTPGFWAIFGLGKPSPHIRFFRATSMQAGMSGAETQCLNAELVLKVESMMRLVSGPQQQRPVPAVEHIAGSDSDTEQEEESPYDIRFLRLEGTIHKAETGGLSEHAKLNQALKTFRPHMPVKDWTLTDVDNWLGGNSHQAP